MNGWPPVPEVLELARVIELREGGSSSRAPTLLRNGRGSNKESRLATPRLERKP